MKWTVRGARGPWVVKVSGIAGGVGLYEEEIAAVAAAGFRVVALDTSGDRHDDPAGGVLTWDRFAGEVDRAIDECGAGRAIVWGTSFGCLVAIAAAARRPERISGLLLCHPPDPSRQPRVYPTLLRWADRRDHPDLAARILFAIGFTGLTSWEGLMPPLWRRARALIAASLDAATPPATVRRKLELLFHDDPGRPPETMPVEIVAGAWDRVAPVAGARRLAERMPGARLTVMGGSGHAGAYTRPRTYHRIVTDALRRLS